MKSTKTWKTQKMKNDEMHAHTKNYAADENIKTIKIEKLKILTSKQKLWKCTDQQKHNEHSQPAQNQKKFKNYKTLKTYSLMSSHLRVRRGKISLRAWKIPLDERSWGPVGIYKCISIRKRLATNAPKRENPRLRIEKIRITFEKITFSNAILLQAMAKVTLKHEQVEK